MAIVFCKEAESSYGQSTDEDGLPLYATSATSELNRMRKEIIALRSKLDAMEKDVVYGNGKQAL